MTLIINLDEREVEIEGIVFGVKPLTNGTFELLTQITQFQGKKDIDLNNIEESQNVGMKMLNDKKYQATLSKIISKNCRMIEPFQIQEKGEIRDGTMDEFVKFETVKFLEIKQKLVNELMQTSNLTTEEADNVKK